ncbi:hypothetical protein [Luteibacter sahnii]|uniref:hypothetical protein n=1 Tax=Luteibacter sahnii TaxID=3021977 RepID=UPI002A6B0277|nr:hypothetical protein [Luteibacter sp. PPL193]MDY1549147.1 hypothetical protein [Luteibacter sp. PPL193]
MTLDLLRLMDIFDGRDDAAELMAELLDEQMACTRASLMSLLATGKDRPVADAVLSAYGRLDPVMQARLLASAEFGDALATWEEARHKTRDELERALDRLLEQIQREDALHRLSHGDVVAWMRDAPDDRVISPMGDRVAIRENGAWRLERVPGLDGLIAVDFDSALARRHEPDSGTLSQPCLEVSADERERIVAKLAESLELIDVCEPHFGLMIRSFVRRIIVRKSVEQQDVETVDQNFRVGSESRPQQPGTIRLLNPQLTQKSFVACMESMLHECVHNVLAAYERGHGKFMDSGVVVRPVSPWSGNPIPNHSLAHAIIVYYVCHRLFDAILRSPVDLPASERAELERRMGDFGAGFLIGQRLAEQFLLDEPPTDDFIAAIDGMQASMREFYASVDATLEVA